MDDEVLARRNLSFLLDLEPDFEVIGECDEGESALRAIEETHPDLVFLDIQMPRLDGFQVLGGVPRERMPLIVFVTAYDQFAVQAFEAQALDYLLKPFRRERFRASLDRVRRTIAARDGGARDTGAEQPPPPAQSMIVKCRDRLAFVSFDSLEFVRAAANYVHLHLSDATYEVRERMSVMEERLPADRFLRIHRSYIVNIAAIRELYAAGGGEYMVSLRGGRQLPVGPSYVEAVHGRLLTTNAPQFGGGAR
ncbi:MAG: LytTR family transcriptional regulator DNA-binding domain-containing protein [Sinobacteraceae bacterium]|nr:LytTR family transcriptional regulator DNA-binding domain-containing protein [Nevskiaceae bacterium]